MKIFSKLLTESTSQLNGFCILKPGFINHEDEFLKLLDNNGWKVIQKQKRKLTKPEAQELYKMHKDKNFYNDLCDYMCSDDCFFCTCYKDCKDPIKDMDALKDKVRKTWGEDEMKNCMHSSDSIDNVNRESKLIFEKKLVESEIKLQFQTEPQIQQETTSDIQQRILDLKLSYTEQEALAFLNMLQDALAEELNAWYAYMIIIPFLEGMHKEEVVDFFKDTAKDELEDHAYWLMERINQLGAYPNEIINSTTWDNVATHKYIVPSPNILEAIRKNIEAEKGAIETYEKIEKFTRDRDVVSNTKIKEILGDEQQHLADLYDLEKDFIG